MTNTSETSCYHCHLPLPDENIYSGKINEEEHLFCCNGCKLVCEAIFGSGMQGFYRRTPDGTTLQPPPEIDDQLELYDLDEIQLDYVHHIEQSGKTPQREIHLLIEGIHCAACVWLIEQRIGKLSGVIETNVNLSARKLRLRWDNEQIKLSTVMQKLGEIGYAAVPFDPEVAEGSIKKQNRGMLFRLGFAAFAAMNLMWISIALYTGADEGDFKNLFYWISMALATPTLLYSGYPFYKGAITGIVNRHLNMDLPIAIGATITYIYSCYVVITGSEIAHVYFDTVVNFIFVILTGRYLEAMSKRMAVQSSQRLIDLQPKIATKIENNDTKVVPVKSLQVGDLVMVKAGEKIPVDGKIIKGGSVVDESMLTGEFVPVSKSIGDMVSAGTANKEGVLTVQVTQLLRDTNLGKIIHLVDEAQSTKAPIQCTADRIIPWFVSITLLLSLITFIIWFDTDFEFALMAATSVLIITCPCAFGLATPMAIAVATGVGAKKGVLIKHGAVLEVLSSIRHFVFDKTGTLTQGKMQVSQMFYIDSHEQIEKIKIDEDFKQHITSEQQKIIQLACYLEKNSEHVIAKSIVNLGTLYEFMDNAKILHELENIKVSSGAGLQAEYHQQKIVVGSLAWIKTFTPVSDNLSAQLVEQMKHYYLAGCTVAYAWLEGVGIMAFVIADEQRENAHDVVKQMQQQGFNITLLSGDKKEVAQYMADKLGITQVIAEVFPDEKDKHIQKLQQNGDKVAMVGDGINDAPALVRADVGIAMGSGTDVSIDSADIILMNGELNKITLAAQLSQATLKTIKQNIGMSIMYNIIMVPLAMLGMITPLVAAIAMPVSSLLVIANAARLRWKFNA